MQKNGWTATVKLLCETDFVAKNESFHEIADTVLEKILSLHQNIENIQAASPELIEQLGQITAEYAGKLGENIKVGDLMSTNLQ